MIRRIVVRRFLEEFRLLPRRLEELSSGILEAVLENRLGPCRSATNQGFVVKHWRGSKPDRDSVLYVAGESARVSSHCFTSVHDIYGDTVGGTLLGGLLRVAMPLQTPVFGLYSLDQLQNQPEVIRASLKRPRATFFMEASNVWFYGLEGDHLCVYDAELAEAECLGPVEAALRRVLGEWDEV